MEPIKGGTLANIPDEAKELLKKEDETLSPAAWALKFVAGLDGVIMILSGMSDFSQLDQNTVLFNGDYGLTEKQKSLLLGEVTAIIKKPQSIACTGCSYCTDGCPKKIDIPAIFSAWNASLGSDGIDKGALKRAYDGATLGRGKASDCIACRKCEKICPQKLKIVKNLKTVWKRWKTDGIKDKVKRSDFYIKLLKNHHRVLIAQKMYQKLCKISLRFKAI